MPLPDLVVWMANRGFTGSLTVERGHERQSFDLENGAAVRASSNNPRQYFGQFLLHYELLTEDQLQQAYRTQRDTGVRLGRILVMIGLIREEQVIQCLRVKIAETMLHAFRWTVGRFQLTNDGQPELTGEISLSVPLIDIHTECHHREEIWRRFDQLFPDPTIMVSVNGARRPSSAPGAFRERLLELARRGLSVEALLLETRATDFVLARELVELHQAGVISPRQPTTGLIPPLPDPASGENHLDLAQQAVEQGRFVEAVAHARAGGREDPDDPRALEVFTELDQIGGQPNDALPPRTARPILVIDSSQIEPKRLTAKQRYILARIDGKRSVQAIMQVSPMHDVEALDIMQAFHKDGWLRFEDL